MKSSRIKTTHVGSLPRSRHITDLVFAREAGVPVGRQASTPSSARPSTISSASSVRPASLIAERLMRFVDIIGPDRVIAGTDCGFSTFAGFGAVDSAIVWLSSRLWPTGQRSSATG